MKEWVILREMNHTYVVCDEKEEDIKKDFRFRMLRENHVDGIVDMDIRNINGEYKIYFDVTDMESLEKRIEYKPLTVEEVNEIFKSLILISGQLENLYCEEALIVLLPELIFKNRITNSYEFICYPGIENESQVTLLEFLVNNLDTADSDFALGLFEAYDMTLTANKSFRSLYEILVSHKQKEIAEEEIEKAPLDDGYKKVERESMVKKLSEKYYIPSLQESLAGLFLLSGLVSICIYIYLGWIS